jgi:hypothetical protein
MMTTQELDCLRIKMQTDYKNAALWTVKALLVLATAIPWAIGWVLGKGFKGLIVVLWAVIYSVGSVGGKLWRWIRVSALVIRKGYWDGLGAQTKPKKPSR